MRPWLRPASVLLLLWLAGRSYAAPSPSPRASAAAQVVGDQLVVPGHRVGPVSLGESIEAVTHTIGAGQIFRTKDYTNMLYPGFTVVVNNAGQQTVHAIVVTDPPYHLKNGVGCGTSEAVVLKLLGPASKVQILKAATKGMIDKSVGYEKLGLTVAFARSKVVQIGIYQPNSH